MRVRAKRAGWDQRDGLVTDTDILDPPAWVDEGLDEWVEGELVETVHAADSMFKERRIVTVGGQLVDPATIEPL